MSLRLKLVIIIIFVAMVPLAISAFSTLSIHQRAFDAKVVDNHRMSAKVGAALVESRLENYKQSLNQTVSSIGWTALTERERDGALWLVYQQIDEIAVAAVLDENGAGLGPSAYLDAASSAQESPEHPRVTMLVLQEFAKRIPFNGAQNKGTAIGEVFVAPGGEDVILPVAFGLKSDDLSGKWVVACGISLAGLCAEVKEMSADGTRVYLVDPSDRMVCGPESTLTLSPIDNKIKAHTSGKDLRDFRYNDAVGEEILAAAAPMPGGFAVVVEQSATQAFSSGNRMRLQTIFWLALSVLVATITGLLLARSISEPIKQLVKGASELAKGNFKFRLGAKGTDELAKLSQTFDNMSGEIEKKDHEIRQWNQELQTRVEKQTGELREVQDQLLHSQKISAVVSLGAGIAHEINNPLASVVGFTQLMKFNSNKDENLKQYKEIFETIEVQSNRIKEIVATFLRFTETFKGEDYIEVNLASVIEMIIGSLEEDLTSKNIEVKMEIDGGLRNIYGNTAKLRQAFTELLKNSCTAMRDGGELTIAMSMMEDRVIKTVVKDTGKGIEEKHLDQIFEPFFTTKDEWSGEGLGLTLAFKIFEEHAGKIKAKSTVGEGTTMTVFLPATKGGAHLE